MLLSLPVLIILFIFDCLVQTNYVSFYLVAMNQCCLENTKYDDN